MVRKRSNIALRRFSKKVYAKTKKSFTRSGQRLASVLRSTGKCLYRAKERKKITGLLLSGPKSFSQRKVKFAFQLKIKVQESGGSSEAKVFQVQCEVSVICEDLGSRVI